MRMDAIPSSLAGTLAEITLAVHFAFVAFAVAGGLLVLRWPRVAWVHLPALVWAAAVMLFGWTCPLTPLEQALRVRAGLETYTGSFIERYIVPVLYPPGLTRAHQVGLGVALAAGNAAVYGIVLRRLRRRR